MLINAMAENDRVSNIIHRTSAEESNSICQILKRKGMHYLSIKRPFELEHVGILFWVNIFIGKVNQEAINVDPKI